MKSNEISQHLATFVRIVNATQTIEFHEWNGESLDRAFSWANALEMLPEKCDATILDAALKQLNTASIPTIERGDHIRIEQLRQARLMVCRALFTSPYLSTHPIRTELVTRIIKEWYKHDKSKSTQIISAQPQFSATLIERFITQRHIKSLIQVSNQISQRCQRVRVRVLSGYIEIPSQRSYLTEPITIHYRALAKTLQANAIVLEHRQQFQKDCTDYKSFLANVSNSLDVGDHHVRSTLACLATLRWVEKPSVHKDVVECIKDWVKKYGRESLFQFKPWLAAMVADQSHDTLALPYISVLAQSGFMLTDLEDYRARVGALILQSSRLQEAIEGALKLHHHFGLTQ